MKYHIQHVLAVLLLLESQQPSDYPLSDLIFHLKLNSPTNGGLEENKLGPRERKQNREQSPRFHGWNTKTVWGIPGSSSCLEDKYQCVSVLGRLLISAP